MNYRCERLKGRVKSTEEWLDEHYSHGGTPVKTYPDPQPPSYRLAQLYCEGCGATHTIVEDKKESDPQ